MTVMGVDFSMPRFAITVTVAEVIPWEVVVMDLSMACIIDLEMEQTGDNCLCDLGP